jgi:hypothetical protein
LLAAKDRLLQSLISLSLSHAAKIYFTDRKFITIMERKSPNKQICNTDSCERHAKKKKKGVEEGKERRLFCFACVQFFCVDFFVCVGYYVRLLCEDLTARRKTGNQKQKIEQLESGLCFLILMNFFLSFFLFFFLLFLCLRACPRIPELFLDQITKKQTKSMCRFLLDAPASAREFVPYNNDIMLPQ